MLRVYPAQQSFTLPDVGIEEVRFNTAPNRPCIGWSDGGRVPVRISILRFLRLLGRLQLSEEILVTDNARLLSSKCETLGVGAVFDANLIGALNSATNRDSRNDLTMHQDKKRNQWRFGMWTRIGAEAYSELAHTLVGTGADVNDVTQVGDPIRGEEIDVLADVHRQRAAKREPLRDRGQLARRRAPWEHRSTKESTPTIYPGQDAPRVIMHQVGYVKINRLGLLKNSANLAEQPADHKVRFVVHGLLGVRP